MPPPDPHTWVDICLHAAERPRWKFMASRKGPLAQGSGPSREVQKLLTNRWAGCIDSIEHEHWPPPAPPGLLRLLEGGVPPAAARGSWRFRRNSSSGVGSSCPPLERDRVSAWTRGQHCWQARLWFAAHISPGSWGGLWCCPLPASNPRCHPTSRVPPWVPPQIPL